MSSVRKQTIVISALIILIACAAWFANSFNETSVKDTNATNDKVTTVNKTLSYFTESKLTKENQFNTSKQEFESIKNNKELSKKARETASLAIIKLVDRDNKENSVETLVKEKGFEDALCMMSDKHIELFVKSPKDLTAEQVHQIKDIIVKTTEYSPNDIVVKQKQ